MESIEQLQTTYAGMTEDELAAVASDAYDLTDTARQVLRTVISSRGFNIEVKGAPPAPGVPEPDTDDEEDFEKLGKSNPPTFDDIVDWAYSTLPQKIKDLPDFPGIQVADEPPEGYLKTRKRRGELLGLYVGANRTERETFQRRPFSDLIFVFRGPILRCSKGDIRTEVKEVVWHEVAHWLGHNEEEVRELGLSRSFKDAANHPIEVAASEIALLQELRNTPSAPSNVMEQPLRCIKCYSADVSCGEGEKPLSDAGANSFDPITLHGRSCMCNSCGYEWDDEDTSSPQ